jgi:hypothetical protein
MVYKINKTFLALVAASLFTMGCEDSFEKQIVGTWSYSFSQSVDSTEEESGQINYNCIESIFHNKISNNSCDLEIIYPKNEERGEAIAKINMKSSSDLIINGKNVLYKTIDSSISIKEVTIGPQKIEDEDFLNYFQKEIEKSSEIKGSVTEVKTIEINKNEWIYEQTFHKQDGESSVDVITLTKIN